jgi:hypothetical protein
MGNTYGSHSANDVSWTLLIYSLNSNRLRRAKAIAPVC